MSVRRTVLASFIGLSLFYTHSTFAAGPNLIGNPGLETNASNSPAGWVAANWGSNTMAATYEVTGHSGSHSVKVTVSNYQSGDAKWYFTPVAVTGGASYTFSDWYIASVATSIVAMSTDASGNVTYFDVSTSVPASSVWKQATYTFTAPANAKTITIFHLIATNGSLQTDDFSLTADAGQSELFIPNHSMETVNPNNANLPTSWSHSKWGTATVAYSYIKNGGHDGTHSVKLTVSNYQSGDAEWVYTPQLLAQGDYRFTAWYKVNAKTTIPHVVAHYIFNDGHEDYFGLPDAEPTGTGWQQYSDTFPVPAGVKSVNVYIFLNQNGSLQTDDYHILPYIYTGFSQGMVTLTFDDGFEENVNTALPVLDQYGFKGTQCNATQFVEGIPSAENIIKKYAADGQEICSHTVTHPWLTQDSVTDMDYELSHSQQYLQQLIGVPITDFASPYGDYNSTVNTEIQKYYSSHRTTDEGFNSKDNFNPYRLRVQNMQINTSLAQVQAWVNKAKADHTWLILIYHVVTTTPPDPNDDGSQFDTMKSDFDAQMAWLSTAGIPVVRWDQALQQAKVQI
jgi:peptidoglycan/xylan/chitin deacetylase (PgdA/CDA1 family)